MPRIPPVLASCYRWGAPESGPARRRAIGRAMSNIRINLRPSGPADPAASRGGFIDTMLQTFENCRPGLTDETIRGGEDRVRAYFAQIYEKELPRLRDGVALVRPHLSSRASGSFYSEVDALVRTVVIPAYARLATQFTRRERNDFFLVPERWRLAERVGWAAAGTLVGAFVVWAPFIPLWSKEWVLPFFVVGILFPALRRYLAMRRYEDEINKLVARADGEVRRMDLAYLTSEPAADDQAALAHETAGAEGISPRDRSKVH